MEWKIDFARFSRTKTGFELVEIGCVAENWTCRADRWLSVALKPGVTFYVDGTGSDERSKILIEPLEWRKYLISTEPSSNAPDKLFSLDPALSEFIYDPNIAYRIAVIFGNKNRRHRIKLPLIEGAEPN